MKCRFLTGYRTAISLTSLTRLLLTGIIVTTASHKSTAQSGDETIAVTARPSGDSILLRWAPLTHAVWHHGNLQGYRIERMLIARNGALITNAPMVVLDTTARPRPEADWESMVANNPYAAIAAQALYGSQFEVDITQSDVFTIVNKAKENEQRFTFALFSADMSPPVAKASGLWHADHLIRPGEKYLYRITVNGNGGMKGSAFVGADDPYTLPRPQHLKADFGDRVVSLRWDRPVSTPYTAFIVERSSDGRRFTKISETPTVTLTPESRKLQRYEYATDSLPDNVSTLYYRVKGITPFGEEGPPSDVVSGSGAVTVETVPYILSAENRDNTSILLRWEFPESNNAAIKGFSVERTSRPQGTFRTLDRDLLHREARRYEDTSPGPVNYYRVLAIGLDGNRYPSHVFFAQLVDSIPPATPTGLQALAHDDGTIALSWLPNQEEDIYGYRIYRSWFLSEEAWQVTEAPIRGHAFADHVDLQTLNRRLYYRLMALDKNQNHSALSPPLEVTLPDKVPPQAPVLFPSDSDTTGVLLTWLPGGSGDIASYKVYRRAHDHADWRFLGTIPAADDSLYYFLDNTCSPGQRAYYTVLSVDHAGLESTPASPVIRTCGDHRLRSAITWRKPLLVRDENRLILRWTYEAGASHGFSIYRSVNNGPPLLLATVSGEEREFSDTIIPGNEYGYTMAAQFANGKKSSLSAEQKIRY